MNDTARRAADVLAALGRRTSLFGDAADLFRDPVWAMLLELYVARAADVGLTPDEAARRSRRPVLIGLRFLACLQDQGLVTSDASPGDPAQALIRLTDRAADLIERSLAPA